MTSLQSRAARHAALGDPIRLAIVDALTVSDRAPVELRQLFALESNLLAHHLDVLEHAGLISRSVSSGDARRRYVRLTHAALVALTTGKAMAPRQALFICSHNSARSQLAAALWQSMTRAPAESAGTHPATRVHPGAIAAAKRIGLDLHEATPRSLDQVAKLPGLVITVCDQAHEEIDARPEWLHWSIADPVVRGTRQAFDTAVAEIRERIDLLSSGRQESK